MLPHDQPETLQLIVSSVGSLCENNMLYQYQVNC